MCVAAREKEKATSSVSELLQAIKRPRAFSESGNRPFIRKSGGGSENVEENAEKLDKKLRRKSDSAATFRPKPQPRISRNSMERISELPENKLKSCHRRSFMG